MQAEYPVTKRWTGMAIWALIWLCSLGVVSGQLVPHPSLLRNHPAIGYARAPVTDAAARLNTQLQAGEATIESSGQSGYLRSVLRALNVPVESQVLVFSKTSFQAPRINPSNPRAIYFNDTVAVGWVRGGPGSASRPATCSGCRRRHCRAAAR